MGLDIDGFYSDKTYHWGSSGLHQIRALAIQVAGKRDTFDEAFEYLMFEMKDMPKWKNDYYGLLEDEGLLDFHQLLHFSDSEGIMIKDWHLKGIDTSRSMTLGCLGQLYEELEIIREAVTTDVNKYNRQPTMKIFWMLYNLVKDEAENGIAIVFS